MESLTLDQFGRIEIPETIRQQLGINQETKLSLKIENGELILKPLQPQLETDYDGEIDPLIGLFKSSPDLAMQSEDILHQEIKENSGWTWKEK